MPFIPEAGTDVGPDMRLILGLPPRIVPISPPRSPPRTGPRTGPRLRSRSRACFRACPALVSVPIPASVPPRFCLSYSSFRSFQLPGTQSRLSQ